MLFSLMADTPHNTTGTAVPINGTKDTDGTSAEKSGASLAEVRARIMSMGSSGAEPKQVSNQKETGVAASTGAVHEHRVLAAQIQNPPSPSPAQSLNIPPETRIQLEEPSTLVTSQKETGVRVIQATEPASKQDTSYSAAPHKPTPEEGISPRAYTTLTSRPSLSTLATTPVKIETPDQKSNRPEPGVMHQTWGTAGYPGISITGKPLTPSPDIIQTVPTTAQKTFPSPSLSKVTAVPPAPTTQKASVSSKGMELGDAPQVLRKKVSHSPSVQAIRTFRTDAMQAVDKNKISMVGAIAAEQERRLLEKKKHMESRESTSVSPGAFYLLGIATTLIVLGGITFAAVHYLADTRATSTAVTLSSPIFVEAQKKISLDGLRRSEVMNALTIARDETQITVGAITGLYPTMRSDAIGAPPSPGDRLATTEEFFSSIDAHLPGSLVRALAPNFLLGVHEFSKNEPFLLIPVTDYDNAYAGMLAWEADMSNDLAPLFGPAFVEFYRAPSALTYRDVIKEFATTSTSTGTVRSSPEFASSTTPLTLPNTATTSDALQAKGFEDARFRNKEVRVLRREDGTIAILYSFLSRDMLLITTNEFTLKEVLTRFTSKRF